MRVCMIYSCGTVGDRRCCADCDEPACLIRCQNHPNRCNCWAEEEKRKQGQKKGTVLDPKAVLELAKNGLTYAEIARKLNCGISSVQYHLVRIGYRRRQTNRDG